MSGLGSRFIEAGYTKPKPLIEVAGKPIIEYVAELFPGEEDYVFICRREHVENTEVVDVLKRLKPQGKIVVIEGHKLGPVYAVSQAYEHIKPDSPIIVNYCDFFMNWDYADFKQYVQSTKCDGCIPCYTGFHPHLLHPNNLYASCKVDENMNLLEIREKYSHETDKKKAFHSAGTYYFKNGEMLKKYCDETMHQQDTLNGEYYVSLVYNHLLQDARQVKVYEKIPHFCQWGTPFDLEEFNYWEQVFKKYK